MSSPRRVLRRVFRRVSDGFDVHLLTVAAIAIAMTIAQYPPQLL